MIENSKNKLLVEALPASEKNLRTFGVGGGVILLVIWLVGILLLNRPVRFYLPALAIFFAVSGHWFQSIIRPIYQVWMAIAIRIGHVVTLTILYILFYVVITPIGMIRRARNADALDLSWDTKSTDSYWKDHDLATDKLRYTKEF